MALSRQDVRDYVRLRLGAGFVRVELEDKHIDQATDEAVKVYGRYMPLRRYIKIDLRDTDNPTTGEPTGVAYKLPDDITGVYRMDFVSKVASQAVVEDIFHRRYYEPLHDMDSYARYLHYIDMLKRVLSIEPDWHFNPEKHEVLIWAPHQAGTLLAMAVCFAKRELHQIPNLHEDWVERYALAFCKEVIARIRGKWSNVPAPGGAQQLDASTLLAESQAEMIALKEEIKGWQVLNPPIWG